MNSHPPPPPPPPQNPQGGPGRMGTPPVGFGPGSSPLAQVRPQPISRTSTPSNAASHSAAGVSPAHSDSTAAGVTRSPFAGQPAPFQQSPGPVPPQGTPPGPRTPRPQQQQQQMSPMNTAPRVTSPLARTAALSPSQIAGTPPMAGFATPLRPMGYPPQNTPPAPPQQYQQGQQGNWPPHNQQMPPPQPNYGQPMAPPQGYPQQVAGLPPSLGSPPPPASQAGVGVGAPVPAPLQATASARRRHYPDQVTPAAYQPQQMAPPQQQQQQQQQYPQQPVQQFGQVPQFGGGAQQQQPVADPASGQSGGFFVPGAAQAPVPPASAVQGNMVPGYPTPPMPQAPAYPPQQPQMDAVSQQFSNMALGSNSQEYQIALLSGKPVMAALDEQPPVIKLPPNATCVPSPNAVCPPQHKRSTLNAVPKTDKLLKKTKLPFGLVITPFKTQDPGEEPIPIVPEIVRCRRCRTYINPFVQFVEGGRRWKCNMCSLSNDVPLQFDYDSATQTQKNRWIRPDLNYSVVEFIAPLEYMVRPPMPPVYVFIIDVSYASVQLGAPGVIGKTILSALDRIPNVDNRAKVAFIAVDSSLHFFQVRPNSTEPQQLVVSDLEEIFLPSPTDLLLNLHECREGIECLLSRMESMFKSNHSVGNALSPAIQAAQKMLGTLGGKIVVLQASLPTIGEGKIEPRPEGKDLGTPRESELLRPQNNWYKSLAADCSRIQIAFDTVFIGQQPMDVATVSCLAHYTGGSVFHYPSFMATRKPEVERFTHEFSNHLAAHVGLEAVLRIRASKGLRMASYYGNFFLRSLDLLALPNVTPNHSYAVDIEIDETITTPMVYFQTALLHTSSSGERRIRVSTLALPTTENIHTVFHHADQIAIASLMSKKAVDRAVEAKLEDARDALQYKTLEIIGAFKTECTQSSSGATTQLQIPRALQLLPFLTLASLKHTSLRSGNNIPPALRVASINNILTLPAEQGVQPYTVARLYSLHDLPPQAGYADENTGIIELPPRLGLSADILSPYGIFLLHNGCDSFLWIGRDANPALCKSLLDVQDVRMIPNGVIAFPDFSNGADSPAQGFELNFQVNGIMRRLNQLCHDLWKPVTYICKEDGDPMLRMAMTQWLSEDMDTSAPSYQQFLNQLRDKINRGNF
ncbi:COPII subunit [Coemansia sp. RSA 2607]|nr:COPII subunit [Coemansia sp. RSA 2607]